MAKKNETTPAKQEDKGAVRDGNMITDVLALDAFKEIEKEKDEKKKRDAKQAICAATYMNMKTRAQLRARRREDDITKEKLTATKDLLERTIGVRCEITEGGRLKPTKEVVPEDQRLTLSEYREERDKLNQNIVKKMRESDEVLNKDVREIRESLESEYTSWWDR